MLRKIKNNHIVARFFAIFIIVFSEVYPAFIAFIVLATSFHWFGF